MSVLPPRGIQFNDPEGWLVVEFVVHVVVVICRGSTLSQEDADDFRSARTTAGLTTTKDCIVFFSHLLVVR